MPAPPSMSEMQSARAFENSLFISPQPLSNRSFQLVYRRLNENSSVAGKNSFSLAQTAAKRGKSTGLQRVHCRRLLTDNRADLLGVHSYKELENQYLSLRLGELREPLPQVHALRPRAPGSDSATATGSFFAAARPNTRAGRSVTLLRATTRCFRVVRR